MLKKYTWILAVLFVSNAFVLSAFAGKTTEYSPVHERRMAWKDKKKKQVYSIKKVEEVEIVVSSDDATSTKSKKLPLVKKVKVPVEIVVSEEKDAEDPAQAGLEVKNKKKKPLKNKFGREVEVYNPAIVVDDRKEKVIVNALTENEGSSSSAAE